MMKTPSTRSERSSKPGGLGNHGESIPPAALAEPPPPTVETARGTADANHPTSSDSVGTAMKGKARMVARKFYTPVIAKIMLLCGICENSIMARYIYQQGWTELEHVAMIDVKEVKDFFTVDPDGNFEAKPMMVHLRMFKAFLLFYSRKRSESPLKITEEDMLLMPKGEFNRYCGTDKYHFDLAVNSVNETLEECFSGNIGDDKTMLLTTPALQGCLEWKKEH
jgi:hypothetical protein